MRAPVTLKHHGMRFVASGKSLHYANASDWKVFPDFLRSYLAGILTKEWGERELLRADAQQHPICQWHRLMADAMVGAQPDQNGILSINSGAALAWMRLAYDLYLVEHNAELQKKLLRRLRDPSKFQGARFEATVAAFMVAAGYEITFSNETGPGKHPEFYALHPKSNIKLAVEAKSKHRSGILGYHSGCEWSTPRQFDIYGILRDAVKKNTPEPLLVFVDVNAPNVFNNSGAKDITAELTEDWSRVLSLQFDDGFPCIGVIFYNDVSPWFLSNSLPSEGLTTWLFAPESRHQHRHKIDSAPLISHIVECSRRRCNIPSTFS